MHMHMHIINILFNIIKIKKLKIELNYETPITYSDTGCHY